MERICLVPAVVSFSIFSIVIPSGIVLAMPSYNFMPYYFCCAIFYSVAFKIVLLTLRLIAVSFQPLIENVHHHPINKLRDNGCLYHGCLKIYPVYIPKLFFVRLIC